MVKKSSRKTTKRTYVRKPKAPTVVDPFVVYVTFPSSMKEYSYLCNIPNLRQGDKVIANNCTVTVVRTAASDLAATRWVRPVPSQEETERHNRTIEIVTRLNKMFAEFDAMNRFALMAKTNPEAKKLLAELKLLRQS